MSMSPSNVEQIFVGEKEWFVAEPEKMAEQIQEKTTELAIGVNARELAFYNQKELQTGQRWFPTNLTQIPYRYGFRFVYFWDDNLPDTTSVSKSHGIPEGSSITWFTNLTGVAVNGTPTWMSLPNAECTIFADATNVTLTTTADLSAYTGAYIVMEYLKQD